MFETTADTAVLFPYPKLIFITKIVGIYTNQVETNILNLNKKLFIKLK